MGEELKDIGTEDIYTKENKKDLGAYIEENKKIYLPTEDIEKDEELKDFALDNKGVWFRHPHTPLKRMGGTGEVEADTIFYIDKDNNLVEVEIDFGEVTMPHEELEAELEKLDFIEFESTGNEGKNILKRLVNEAGIYQNKLKDEEKIEAEKSRQENFDK